MFGAVREVFLQESHPEVSPRYLLCPGLHQLLHPHLPIFCIGHQEKCDERELLCISAVDHPTNLLALPKPGIYFIRSGFASECGWPMPNEVLHSHWLCRWNHGSRLRCNRLHNIHHSMDCIRNLISSNSISPPPICHSLRTPHSQLFKLHNSS